MHGFPLTFPRIRKQMHRGKRKFSTEKEAQEFSKARHIYLCPFCCMYHLSSHKSSPRYEQEKWWIIWESEIELQGGHN